MGFTLIPIFTILPAFHWSSTRGHSHPYYLTPIRHISTEVYCSYWQCGESGGLFPESEKLSLQLWKYSSVILILIFLKHVPQVCCFKQICSTGSSYALRWATSFIVKSEQLYWIRIPLFKTQKSCWTRIWFQTGGIHLCVQGQRYMSSDTQVLTMNCLKSFSEHFQTFKRILFKQNTNRNSCRKDQQGVRTVSLYL